MTIVVLTVAMWSQVPSPKSIVAGYEVSDVSTLMIPLVIVIHSAVKRRDSWIVAVKLLPSLFVPDSEPEAISNVSSV